VALARPQRCPHLRVVLDPALLPRRKVGQSCPCPLQHHICRSWLWLMPAAGDWQSAGVPWLELHQASIDRFVWTGIAHVRLASCCCTFWQPPSCCVTPGIICGKSLLMCSYMLLRLVRGNDELAGNRPLGKAAPRLAAIQSFRSRSKGRACMPPLLLVSMSSFDYHRAACRGSEHPAMTCAVPSNRISALADQFSDWLGHLPTGNTLPAKLCARLHEACTIGDIPLPCHTSLAASRHTATHPRGCVFRRRRRRLSSKTLRVVAPHSIHTGVGVLVT